MPAIAAGRSGWPSTVTWLRPRRRAAVLAAAGGDLDLHAQRVESAASSAAWTAASWLRPAPQQDAEHQPAADDDLLDVDHRHVDAGTARRTAPT